MISKRLSENPGRYGVFLLFLIFLTGISAQAQDPAANLVPNPGFEEYATAPIGWFYKGDHFTEVMKYWSSPTGASPDVFGPRVHVPASWADKGFGRQAPHGGVSMVGITLFGCEEGKPHCREYLQIQLLEPLVIGQNYYFEFWACPLPRSLRINQLAAHFAQKEIALKTAGLLPLLPQIIASPGTDGNAGSWTKISGRFIAQQEADYLVIGNFFPDSLTQQQAPGNDALPFAYYYIDDVLVRKEEPIIPVPIPEDDLTRVEIKAGKTIPLKNIFFETDQAELLPRSYLELNKLLQVMRRHPLMVIQINGHTDTRGTDTYNRDLSERRARAAVDFLSVNGVTADRLHCRGFGSAQPVASNDTEAGRQLNRRVEFVVLKMGE